MPNPTRIVTRPQDDAGLFEVEAVRSAVLNLGALVTVLARSGQTGLSGKVEDAAAMLYKAASEAEAEIKERQTVRQ